MAVFEDCSAHSVQLAIDSLTFTPVRKGEESGEREKYRVYGLEMETVIYTSVCCNTVVNTPFCCYIVTRAID